MSDASCPVAVIFVEKSYLEKQIMENQKDNAPFQERQIKTAETLRDERPGVGHILSGEEIAGTDEKYRHVERVDEIRYQLGRLGVPDNHKNDCQTLDYRNDRIALSHTSKSRTLTARRIYSQQNEQKESKAPER